MKVIEYKGGVDRRALDAAADALRAGDIIIYPTDTLYALGCDALNNRAIERLCRIKGLNPDKNFLSVVCSDLSQASEYAKIDNVAFRMLKHYLPGPFTFILPASTSLPKVFKGRKTVGIRIPDCEFARALAEELGHPIMTTSVPVVEDSSLDGAAVALALDSVADIVLAIDGGEGGNEGSTIIDCCDSRSPEILRQGSGLFEG